jgi:branched-subunit amino acid aminotransferase/4-amino-4-deoxychorismate lyase
VSGPGIFETMRVREGRLPLLDRHLARLADSAARLGLPRPSAIVREVAEERAADVTLDRILRLGWSAAGTAWAERGLGQRIAHRLVPVRVPHPGYPVKSEDRRSFELAQTEAELADGTEPLLLTRRGEIAETARYAILWQQGSVLCYPAADLGVLPSIGLGRILELAAGAGVATRAVRVGLDALRDRPAWLVNAVRGLVHVASLDGRAVPSSDALREVARAFWPAA